MNDILVLHYDIQKDDIDMSLVSCDFEENSGYIYVQIIY